MKPVRGEIIRSQILSIVVRGHIVDMHLVALLDVVEEEVNVRHVEDHLLHPVAQLHDHVLVLRVPIRVDPRQQRVEDDDRLVQIPHEHAIRRRFHAIRLSRIRARTPSGTWVRLSSASTSIRLLLRRWTAHLSRARHQQWSTAAWRRAQQPRDHSSSSTARRCIRIRRMTAVQNPRA